MERILKICLIFLIFHTTLLSQGISNLWMMGYASYAGPPWGGIDIDFITAQPVITYVPREMEFRRAVSNICDSSGNLLFVTNGVYIADATGDTMMNGSGLNPSVYTSWYPDGLPPPQMNIIIPDPGNSDLYYLFHTTIDDPFGALLTRYLYYSIVDMNLNSGLGAVTAKNQVLLNDSLCKGNITACKHANGRDWWLICHKAYSSVYYKFLITPYGIQGPMIQSIGINRTNDVGQAVFSSDGNYFACYNLPSNPPPNLEIFNFDRCTGLLSNPVHIAMLDSATGVGVAFSPKSKFLYVSSLRYVYQFDVTATNIPATQTTVAVWDGFYSPNPPFGTFFDIAQLAPDGKIYIATGNGTFHLHVINQPDSAGIACDLVQHGLLLPAYNFNSLPNHPNYFLGCDTSSTCQCLTSDIPEWPDIMQVKTYPNPTNGPVTFQFPVQSIAGEMAVYDVNGKLVFNENIAPWSQFKKLDLTNLGKGIYFCKLRWGEKQGAAKIILE